MPALFDPIAMADGVYIAYLGVGTFPCGIAAGGHRLSWNNVPSRSMECGSRVSESSYGISARIHHRRDCINPADAVAAKTPSAMEHCPPPVETRMADPDPSAFAWRAGSLQFQPVHLLQLLNGVRHENTNH